MSQLEWDKVGERFFETGVDHGVLYKPNAQGEYDQGFVWNGLTAVNESPEGAESNKQYADNIAYLNLQSAEEFNATIEAFYSPVEFDEHDGTARPRPGVAFGQQRRKPFGFSYRTLLGNDLEGVDYGYKIHLVYNALAAPSEKGRATMNDSPEAAGLSWELSTTPVAVGVLGGVSYRPTAHVTITSTEVDPDDLAALEEALYGTESTDPRLPLPAEVYGMFGAGATTEVVPAAPTYNSSTDTITIPSSPGVVYYIDGEPVTGDVVITEDTVVTARPAAGYKFTQPSDDDWYFDHT